MSNSTTVTVNIPLASGGPLDSNHIAVDWTLNSGPTQFSVVTAANPIYMGGVPVVVLSNDDNPAIGGGNGAVFSYSAQSSNQASAGNEGVLTKIDNTTVLYTPSGNEVSGDEYVFNVVVVDGSGDIAYASLRVEVVSTATPGGGGSIGTGTGMPGDLTANHIALNWNTGTAAGANSQFSVVGGANPIFTGGVTPVDLSNDNDPAIGGGAGAIFPYSVASSMFATPGTQGALTKVNNTTVQYVSSGGEAVGDQYVYNVVIVDASGEIQFGSIRINIVNNPGIGGGTGTSSDLTASHLTVNWAQGTAAGATSRFDIVNTGSPIYTGGTAPVILSNDDDPVIGSGVGASFIYSSASSSFSTENPGNLVKVDNNVVEYISSGQESVGDEYVFNIVLVDQNGSGSIRYASLRIRIISPTGGGGSGGGLGGGTGTGTANDLIANHIAVDWARGTPIGTASSFEVFANSNPIFTGGTGTVTTSAVDDTSIGGGIGAVFPYLAASSTSSGGHGTLEKSQASVFQYVPTGNEMVGDEYVWGIVLVDSDGEIKYGSFRIRITAGTNTGGGGGTGGGSTGGPTTTPTTSSVVIPYEILPTPATADDLRDFVQQFNGRDDNQDGVYDEAAVIAWDGSAVIDIASNDTVTHTSVFIFQQPIHGSATLAGSVLTYLPTSGYFGWDQVGYALLDQSGIPVGMGTLIVGVHSPTAPPVLQTPSFIRPIPDPQVSLDITEQVSLNAFINIGSVPYLLAVENEIDINAFVSGGVLNLDAIRGTHLLGLGRFDLVMLSADGTIEYDRITINVLKVDSSQTVRLRVRLLANNVELASFEQEATPPEDITININETYGNIVHNNRSVPIVVEVTRLDDSGLDKIGSVTGTVIVRERT